MQTFEMAPMDTRLRASTGAVLALVAGCCILLVWLSARADMPGPIRATLLLSAVATLGPAIGAYVFAPRALRVDGGVAVIERVVGLIRIAATRAQLLPPEQLQGSLRTFGVGGLFGSYGRFRNRTLGSYRKYATRSTGYVILSTDGIPVVITPAEPEAFVRGWSPRPSR
jgi:Bacterial PH domain